MEEIKKREAEELKEAPGLFRSLLASDLPKIYFNSFTNGLGNTDVVIALERNRQPVAILNASFTTIKSFAQKLTELIEDFEKATGRPIMTGDYIGAKMIEAGKEKDADAQD